MYVDFEPTGLRPLVRNLYAAQRDNLYAGARKPRAMFAAHGGRKVEPNMIENCTVPSAMVTAAGLWSITNPEPSHKRAAMTHRTAHHQIRSYL